MDLSKKVFLAKLAYEPDTSLITEQLNFLFDISGIEYIYVERTDTEGFIFRTGNDCVIAFSGTESMKDLWQDLIFIPSKYKSGYLHSGFKKIMRLVHDPVRDSVNNLFKKEKPDKIIAIGHSLGAPIAMGACDSLFLSHYSSEREIVTFGCPNGWSKKARESFNRRHPNTINFINPFDYVTYLLGITTGRPGKDIKLSGKYGHMMSKYIYNIGLYNQ